MVQGFDKTETGFTATALNLAATIDETEVDFDAWGIPERTKINEICDVVNLFQWKRRGVI